MQTEKYAKQRRVLSLKERIDVIKLAKVEHNSKVLAQYFDCGRTQILNILQQKKQLLQEWKNREDPHRIRRKQSPFAVAINKMIVEWIHRCRFAQKPLTDEMIIEQAHHARKLIGYHDLKPNKRWLQRLKQRYKFYNIDLGKPDPSCRFSGPAKSLELLDIFQEVKKTLDPTTLEGGWMAGNSYVRGRSPVEQANVDGKVEKVEDLEELLNSSDKWGLYEDEIEDDEQALKLIEKLENYAMFKVNFRAIGLLEQLTQLFKGELTS